MTYMQSPELTLSIARHMDRERVRLHHEYMQVPSRGPKVRAFAVHLPSRLKSAVVAGKTSALPPSAPESLLP